MNTHDIIIVGGGPGGISTALHLAKDFPHLTHRILILEKKAYPRPKLCAGGLVIDAEVLLEHLGLDVREVPHVDADRIRFDFEGRGLTLQVRRRHALRLIRREEFDHWLAKKAESRGVEIRQKVTVRRVLPDDQGVTVETDQGQFRALVVVGADGSNGITRRCILPNAAVHTARVLEVVTPLSNAEVECGRQHTAYFDFSPVPVNIAGYVWDFPTQIQGEIMRCWGIYDTNLLADQPRPPLTQLLAREMSRFGLDLHTCKIQGHPIRSFSPRNPLAVPRVLLVGDAAGADPFVGEGISIALGYGMLAAREIAEAFRHQDFSFRGYKRRVLTSALGLVLISRWAVAHIVYPLKWKWFQVLVWRFFKPVVGLLARLFIINWGKRMPSTP
jgi:flavin-dependent dehydrogenase